MADTIPDLYNDGKQNSSGYSTTRYRMPHTMQSDSDDEVFFVCKSLHPRTDGRACLLCSTCPCFNVKHRTLLQTVRIIDHSSSKLLPIRSEYCWLSSDMWPSMCNRQAHHCPTTVVSVAAHTFIAHSLGTGSTHIRSTEVRVHYRQYDMV